MTKSRAQSSSFYSKIYYTLPKEDCPMIKRVLYIPFWNISKRSRTGSVLFLSSVDNALLQRYHKPMNSFLYSITIQQIEIFLTVYEEESFNRAATILHLTQSAISKNVAKLEQMLGFSLFHRTTRSIRPTEAGQALYEVWKQIPALVDQGRREALSVLEAMYTTVRIGLLNTVRPELYFHSVMKRFQDAHPEMKLTLGTGYILELEQKLLSGSFDAIMLPDFEHFWAEKEGFSFLEAVKGPAMVLVSEEHPLSSSHSLTMEEIAHEDFVILRHAANSFYLNDFEARFAPYGVRPRVVSHFESAHDMKLLFRLNPAALVLLDSFFDFPETEGIKKIPLSDQENGIICVYNKKYRKPALEAFLEALTPSAGPA